jgi:hypothetical protein
MIRVSETDNLEKEAKEMEMRLRLLQERMQQQRIDDENLVRPGGARWNGARLDKGSVLSYGKDLQEKYKKKRDAEGGGDPALWPSSQQSSSKKAKPSEATGKAKGTLIFSLLLVWWELFNHDLNI